MLHAVAGKAACLGEALKPDFAAYNEAVVANACALAEELGSAGLRIVSGGTDCGLLLVDLRGATTGDVAAKTLEAAGLAVNKNLIPFDERSPEAPSGLRPSSNAGTARGFGPAEFREIGRLIAALTHAPPDAAVVEASADAVRALCSRFPIYPSA